MEKKSLHSLSEVLAENLELLIQKFEALKKEHAFLEKENIDLKSKLSNTNQILEGSGELNKKSHVDLKKKIEKAVGQIDKIVANLEA